MTNKIFYLIWVHDSSCYPAFVQAEGTEWTRDWHGKKLLTYASFDEVVAIYNNVDVTGLPEPKLGPYTVSVEQFEGPIDPGDDRRWSSLCKKNYREACIPRYLSLSGKIEYSSYYAMRSDRFGYKRRVYSVRDLVEGIKSIEK